MRHSEIAESPSKRGYYSQKSERHARRRACRRLFIEQVCDILKHAVCRDHALFAHIGHHDDRNDHQCEKHEQSLKKVCPRHRKKSAEESVHYYNDRPDNERSTVIEREYIGKQFRSCREHRRRIYRKEYKYDYCRDRAQYSPSILKAVAEITRYRQRIPCDLRIYPKTLCDEQPVEERTYHKS